MRRYRFSDVRGTDVTFTSRLGYDLIDKLVFFTGLYLALHDGRGPCSKV